MVSIQDDTEVRDGLISRVGDDAAGLVIGEDCPAPKIVSKSGAASADSVAAMLAAARRYHAFWHTGDERCADEALAADFIDLNVPDNRPQRRRGPLVAPRHLRQVRSHLAVTLEHAWIVGDKLICRMTIIGHFAETLGEVVGDGRFIASKAIGTYTIENGLITSVCHLDDNLSLLKQLGVTPS